ncbi:unnamed protein product [Adineta ricciae]|uniref:Uncharacterized protein n=1 Tax=Adineta ricciae TaxID=249248 RepID=A0A814WQ16_ADIRI|nr:unnamed protein product [Adineta ricciae]CAF1308088.1 unnamed protein product [Adineta ricciae]
MVDVTLIFSDGISISPLCTVNTKNFKIDASIGCKEHGINYTQTETVDAWLVEINYRKINFLTMITHQNRANPKHANIEVFQPRSLVLPSEGMCTGTKCNEDDRSFIEQLSTPAAAGVTDILMMEELITGMADVDNIRKSIHNGAYNALIELNDASRISEAEIQRLYPDSIQLG